MRRLLVVGVALFLLAMVGQFRVPLLPDLGRDLRMTTTELGLLTTVFALGRLATDLPAGVLADRFRARSMLVFVATASACGSALFAAAASSPVAMAAALVLGVASAAGNLTGMTFFASNAPPHRRGAAMAGYGAALRGGVTFGPVASGGLATAMTWRSTMLVGGAVSLLLAVTLWGFGSATWAGREQAPPHRAPSSRAVCEAKPFLPRQRLALSLVPFAALATQGAFPLTLIPIIGVDSLGHTTTVVGLALGFGGLLRIAGTLAGGWLADRIGRRPVLVPGLLLQATGVALLAIEGRTWAWVASVGVFSAAAVGSSVAAAMLGDQASPDRVGREVGRFRLMGDIGLLVGPLVLVRVFDLAGQRAAALAAAAILVSCAVGVWAYLPETHGPADGRFHSP